MKNRLSLIVLVLALSGALGSSFAVPPQDVTVVTRGSATATGLHGSAPTSRGVLRMGGFDGTNDRDLSVDTSGRLALRIFDNAGNGISSTGGALNINVLTSSINVPVSLAAQTLTAIAVSPTNAANTLSNPFFVRLTDGTNGAIVADGAATPVSRGVVLVAGNDGSNIRMLSLDSSGRLRTLTLDGSGNAITSTANALDVNIKSTTGNVPVDINAQTLTAVKVSATAAANTLSNPLFNRQADADGNNATVRRATAPSATQGALPQGVFDGTNMQLQAGDSSGRARVVVHDTSGNGITSSASGASGRALDVTVRDVFGGVSDHVSQTGTLTTNATTANQVVVTYTVPAGKDFLFAGGWLAKDQASSAVDMAPARLRVGANTIMSYPSSGTADRYWELRAPSFPVKIATAGDVVTVTVTPGAATSTVWRGVLFGYLRDI